MLTRFARNRIILLLYCFSQTVLFAQNKQIDSLLSVLKTAKDDTSKVNTLIALSKQLRQASNFTDAKKYAEKAISLAENINFENGIAGAYNNMGIFYFYQNDYPEALKNYLASLNVREKIGDNQGIADCYHNIGYVYHNQGNYPEAIKNYFASIRAKEKTGDKGGMARSYGNIGLIYLDERNYSEALKNQLSALKLFEESKDKIGIAGTTNNIGLVYENQGNYSEALKYYFETLKLYRELGNKQALVNRYFNIGFLYEGQGNYSEALKNHQEALKISEEIGNDECIAVSHNNIAALYYQQSIAESRPDQRKQLFGDALKNYLNALEGYKKINDKEGLAGCYNGMGGLFLEMKNYAKAKQFLNEGLARSKENGSIPDIKDSYRYLARLDSATGDWHAAFNDQKLYILYRDSIINEESTGKTMKAQMQFDFDKKEDSLKYQQNLADAKLKQQVLLTRQQKLLKNYLLMGFLLFAILSFFVYKNYRTRQQLKLQQLRNKIASDLHDDVGSTLSSISIFSEMAKQQSKEVIPMLDTIGESSRKMLDAMADIVWTINPENDQFEKIILRMRSFAYELLGAKKIDFEFVAEDDVTKMKLPMEVRKNLYLIFKEATNNIVKYAEANKAMFSIKGEENDLIMLIRDNGKGFDIRQSTQGNGLKNMKKRADEISAQLTIESFPGNGTTIQLRVAV
jgi:signal transduction histidine kinase